MRTIVPTAFLAALFFATGASAQDCALKEYASLDMVTLPSGEIAIPVKVGGVEKNFVVELNSDKSAISGSLADALKLQRSPAPIPHIMFMLMTFSPTGPRPDQVTTTLAEGPVTVSDFPLLVMTTAKPGVDGYLGLNFFRHFEMEIDFMAGKLNLFSPDHCPGKVVYWADSGAGVVPFNYTHFGQIYFTATLDGAKVLTRLSAEPGNGRMAMETAGKLLDVRMNSPSLTPLGTDPDGEFYYRYPFKTLEIGDVTVGNPIVELHPSMNDCDGLHLYSKKDVDMAMCSTNEGLIIGQNELRKLHLFFAFKEAKLYVTAVDAHR